MTLLVLNLQVPLRVPVLNEGDLTHSFYDWHQDCLATSSE